MIEYDSNNIFSKIISNDITSFKVYEDTNTLVIMDVYPEMPGHMLVIPKNKSRNIIDIIEEDLGKLILIVKKISEAQIYVFGAAGCKIKHNCENSAGQVIFHTHFHVIPVFEKGGEMSPELNTIEKQANALIAYLVEN
jgi:histidine triad (HIT) family protein